MKTKFLQRVLWLMIPLLTIFTTNAWGAETLKTTCEGTGSGYGTRRTTTYDGIGWVLASGQTGYLGTGNATSHGNTKPTAADLPVVKAQYGSATTTTTGYYYYYTSTAIANVTKIEITYTAKKGSATVNAYVVSSSTAASSGSATWSKPTLASGTGLSAQGTNIASAVGTYTFKLNAKETSSKYYGVILYTGSYSRLTDCAIKIYVDDAAASCTSNPTVSAASNSSVTSTTATVSCSSGISSLGSAGCSITDYGFVIGTSSNPAIGGSGVTKHQVGTTYTSTGASFSKDLTGLSAETTYYVRPYATNGNGTAYGTQTSFTTSALPKYTITYHVGSGTCATSSWTQTTAGQSTTLPTATPSCDGWSFAGWCTSSAGDEDDNTDSPGTILTGEYTPTNNVDLYAVYTKTEGGGGTSDITIVPGTYTDKGTNNYGSGVERTGTVSTINLGAHYVTGNASGTPGGSSAGQFLQCQGSNANIYNKTALPGRITQVVLHQNSATAFSLYCGDEQLMSSTNTSTGQTPSGTLQTAQTSATTMTWTVSGDYTFFDIKKGSSAGYITSIVITYESGTTYYMTDYECAATPTITVSKTLIEFGDEKVGGTYTETFTVSGENLTGAINLAVSGAQAGKYTVSPATLSPTAGTVAETTITVTFAPTASSDHAAQVDITSDGATPKTVSLHAISKWEVTWKNDGAVETTTLVQGGHKPTFPATPTSCDTEESNVFYGWTDAEWPGKIDNVSAKTIHKSNATMPNASNNTTIYYAVFVKRTGSVDEYTDDLTRATTGVSGTTYTAWSGKTGSSGAVYAGQSAGGNDAIQLRATSPSGIITTTSGGKAKKVTVVWNSNTADGRTLDIYGKSTAYTAASDLYAAAATTQGTKIGSIVYGTSTELTIDDDYAYIGIRSNDGALYLDKVSIDWQDGEYSYSKYMTNCCDYYITVAEPAKTGTGTGTVAFASGGSAVTAGNDVATCAGTTTITATVTPNPGHQCDALSFTGGSVSVSPAIPDPFVPFDDAGATTYTLTFAQNTNATLATAVTFTQLHDYYIDYMHDNAKVTKNGNYGTAPSLSSTTPGDGCAGSHYKFVGWVPESDMNMETGVPNTTTHMVTGGQAGMYATGTNYYAIWAEEVTP